MTDIALSILVGTNDRVFQCVAGCRLLYLRKVNVKQLAFSGDICRRR